mmetsp:Transcript_61031/g.163715  ORF Transcript_61031/g.163715 Transcript_61031/m.163715 type:complete len:697 (-) Transcript_61031:8-2098(-)
MDDSPREEPEHPIRTGDGVSVLGAHANKLCDKSIDKCRQAAEGIAALVSQKLHREGCRRDVADEQVKAILVELSRDFISSPYPNYRKGGLIALACCAVGMRPPLVLAPYLEYLVLPVVRLFSDEEPKVRYAACEAMYNIAKTARHELIPLFHKVFDGVCKLYGDVDESVHTGAEHLDRLVQDIVTETPGFDVGRLVPVLAQRARVLNKNIRELVMSWINVLDSSPTVDMLKYLPELLEGLFNMLPDDCRGIRTKATSILNEFLAEIRKSSPDHQQEVIRSTCRIVVRSAEATSDYQRLTAVIWVQDYVVLLPDPLGKDSEEPSEEMAELLSDLVSGALTCLRDNEEEIRDRSVTIHTRLIAKVEHSQWKRFPTGRLHDVLLKFMTQDCVFQRTACLEWVSMLLDRFPADVVPTLGQMFSPVFNTLRHSEQEVVAAALQVLTQITHHGDFFSTISSQLLRLFYDDRRMLDPRGTLVIRHLCSHLDVDKLFRTVAQAIAERQIRDLEFCDQLVRHLNWILLTAEETHALRDALLAGTPDAEALFREILVPWFYNPVSTLSLCLFVQKYELSYALLLRLARLEVVAELGDQLEQLVDLLEWPIFARMRLHLLSPRQYPYLTKCVLGVAMLLPQGPALTRMSKHLQVTQSGLVQGALAGVSDTPSRATAELLEDFDAIIVQKEDAGVRICAPPGELAGTE